MMQDNKMCTLECSTEQDKEKIKVVLESMRKVISRFSAKKISQQEPQSWPEQDLEDEKIIKYNLEDIEVIKEALEALKGIKKSFEDMREIEKKLEDGAKEIRERNKSELSETSLTNLASLKEEVDFAFD